MRIEHTAFHGLDAVRISVDGASAVVTLHGAHVVSWIPAGPDEARSRERLFLSGKARFDGSAAIRGGVPVIFPQFGERGALPKHGFARTLPWRYSGDDENAAFELRDSEVQQPLRAAWPHAFIARLRVVLGATRLKLTLEVENLGEHAFDFSAALHSYLRVDDIDQAVLQGLQGCDYEDSANGGTLHREHDYELRFAGEIDRIYNDVVAPLCLAEGERRLFIEQQGFPDCVTWNPGAQLGARIGDLEADDYRRFVCVEAGQVLQPVVLEPGEVWEGTQILG